MIQKRFPADITLKEQTFLNDRKIDAELYALFQSYSDSDNGITFVEKWKIPKQSEICSILGIKSSKTYRSHLQYLLKTGYIIEEKDRFILPNMEDIYLLLPLSTIQFMRDVFKDSVVKTYIYLGQKWLNNNLSKEFTFSEIAAHIGIKLAGNERGYSEIRNILSVLSNCGLIEISKEYFIENNQSRRRLINWTDHLIR